jgi:hypothetical protein
MNMTNAASGTQDYAGLFYSVFLLRRLRARQLTRDVLADAGFCAM